MRHKFLGTGEPGYHPLRKLRTIYSGLRYAVIYDFSVAWKLVFSLVVLAAAVVARDWIDSVLIIVLEDEVINRSRADGAHAARQFEVIDAPARVAAGLEEIRAHGDRRQTSATASGKFTRSIPAENEIG